MVVKVMRKLLARRMATAALALLLALCGGVPAAAGETLALFRDAFGKVLDNYVEEPDVAYLATAAMNGMDGVAGAGRPAEPDFGGIAGDRDKALRLLSDHFTAIADAGKVDPQKLEYAAVDAMLKALDPHSGFVTPDDFREMQVGTRGVFAGVGIEIALKEGVLTVVTPIEDSPAFRGGIRAGDQIVRIDGEPTAPLNLVEAVKRMRGEKGSSVTLTIMRKGLGEPADFRLVRDTIRIQSVKSRLLEDGIGYLRIAQFQENTARDAEAALARLGSRDLKLKGLVLDLRNNPGGLLSVATEIADKFVDAGTIVTTSGRVAASITKFEGKTLGTHPPYPVVVLVNEGTVSGAEIVAGALQDLHKGVLAGKRSFGKGTVQTIYPLADGSALRLTTAKYYLPSGRSVQSGIEPDAEVEETEGEDLPLRVAQAALRSAKGARVITVSEKFRQLVAQASRQAGVPPAAVATTTGGGKAFAEQSRPAASDVDTLPLQRTMARKNGYAIVIGIEQYRQRLPKADYATHDAETVTRYLTRVMGYPEENVVTLTNDRAALGDFVKYFERWLANNVEQGGTVLVYYSGHGAPNPRTGDAYLVPYDGDPAFIDQTGYPLRRLYDALARLPAREVVVILDACFSGAGGRSVIAKGTRPLVMQMESALPAGRNVAVLSAAAGDQVSSGFDEKGHGLFTYFLLKGLGGEGDLNNDGSVAIAELYDYLRPQVTRVARRLYNNEQVPQLVLPKGAGQIRLLER